MDTINTQMNTLVESQAEEIKELKETIKDKDDEIQKLKKENKKHISTIEKHWGMDLVKENETIKDEMVTMYHIIINDKNNTCEIDKDQPLIDIVQFNIGLMLEKFKEMQSVMLNVFDVFPDMWEGNIELRKELLELKKVILKYKK